ncbi:MAG: periplasmic heavy metal sensor [Pseudomonadota bacterium]
MKRVGFGTSIGLVLALGFLSGYFVASPAGQSMTAHVGSRLFQNSNQPYAGQDARIVKSLEPARLKGLLAGQGLGYAKTAELTGWPGPLHVLELKSKLGLSAQQKTSMESLRQDMLNRVKPLGAQLIEAEKALEAIFADENPSAASVEAAVANIAEIEGRLRAAHLTTHLAAAPVLNKQQRTAYRAARGYGTGGHGGHSGH